LEFIADIAFYFTVGLHGWLLVWIIGLDFTGSANDATDHDEFYERSRAGP
jgi:hypothetical protein